jgi:hypothetical protein
MRSFWRRPIVACAAFALVGCGGGGVPEGMPANPAEYTPAPGLPSAKDFNTKPGAPPKKTAGGGAAPAPEQK